MDQEGCCAGRLGGVVARHASIVAVMRGRRALYPQREIELADLMRGGLPRLQRPAVLQPGDLQRRVTLADRAGHVHPLARLDIVGKAKRIDFRWYCKLQEAREFISRRDGMHRHRRHHPRRRRHRIVAGRSRVERKQGRGELFKHVKLNKQK